MPRSRTDLVRAAGQLVSAIQKEWTAEMGTAAAQESQPVMDKAHALLQAAKTETIASVLGGRPVREYLGVPWLQSHAAVEMPLIVFEGLLDNRGAA